MLYLLCLGFRLSLCRGEERHKLRGVWGGITNRREPSSGREKPRRSPGTLPQGAEHRARSAPIPPGFCTFPSPPFFFLPSPPFLFFLPLFFFSVPPLSSLPLSLAWLDQSFGISCRRLPRAAVRPRPGAARVPCRGGSGSAGPTRVPAPVPRVSRRCGGGGARRAERGTARGLGRPGQVRPPCTLR